MTNPFLIGPTVYLRPIERTDAPQIAAWLNDPEVTATLARYRPISLKAEEEYLDKLAANEQELALGIVTRASDVFIGVTGFRQVDERNRHACFGIAIGSKEHWSKGFGTETARLLVQHAFATLNLNRIWLHVYEFNERGIRSYEKAGFKREGILRQDIFQNGRYWNTIVMAILRDEWQKSG